MHGRRGHHHNVSSAIIMMDDVEAGAATGGIPAGAHRPGNNVSKATGSASPASCRSSGGGAPQTSSALLFSSLLPLPASSECSNHACSNPNMVGSFNGGSSECEAHYNNHNNHNNKTNTMHPCSCNNTSSQSDEFLPRFLAPLASRLITLQCGSSGCGGKRRKPTGGGVRRPRRRSSSSTLRCCVPPQQPPANSPARGIGSDRQQMGCHHSPGRAGVEGNGTGMGASSRHHPPCMGVPTVRCAATSVSPRSIWGAHYDAETHRSLGEDGAGAETCMQANNDRRQQFNAHSGKGNNSLSHLRLLSRLSHELNTCLNAILGAAQA